MNSAIIAKDGANLTIKNATITTSKDSNINLNGHKLYVNGVELK